MWKSSGSSRNNDFRLSCVYSIVCPCWALKMTLLLLVGDGWLIEITKGGRTMTIVVMQAPTVLRNHPSLCHLEGAKFVHTHLPRSSYLSRII